MAINTYDIGQLVRVYTSTPFTNATTDAVMDPDTVTIRITNPTPTTTNYVYGVDAEVVKSSTGSYYMNVNANAEGIWYYKIFATGNGQSAEEGHFRIRASQTD